MNIGRILYKGQKTYAEIAGDQVKIIDGGIWGDIKFSGETAALADVELLAPVEPRQVVAIGLNYHRHAKECGREAPKEPLLFLKGVNTINGPGKPVVMPAMAPDEIDYEAELVIVIGKETKNVSEDEAGEYIFGYTCGNDVSARDCQLKKDSQWARGKSFDTFAPIGPWITTGIDGDNLKISLTLNGEVMQHSSTSDMIFSCKKVVSFLSQCMTLYPGSIIMTGTPEGVGIGRKPQVYIKEGDTVSVEIENIGTLTNCFIKETK